MWKVTKESFYRTWNNFGTAAVWHFHIASVWEAVSAVEHKLLSLVSGPSVSTTFRDKNACTGGQGDDMHPPTAHIQYMQHKPPPNMKRAQAWITSIQSNFNINSYWLRLNCKGLNFLRKMGHKLRGSSVGWHIFPSHLLWVLDPLDVSQKTQ